MVVHRRDSNSDRRLRKDSPENMTLEMILENE